MFFKSTKKNENKVDGFSHLGESFKFEGEIDCKGEIEIAGQIKGSIKAKKLRILETGKVRGFVYAQELEILGYMNGNVETNSVHVGSQGVLKGNLSFEKSLSVLEGANLTCRVQKIKNNIKMTNTNNVKYLEHNQLASKKIAS
jgi:cytoskeletal protein CcmA (bactofilin family)